MVFAAIAFGVLFVFSAYRIVFRMTLSRPARCVLLGIRFFLLALIAVAFIEPIFIFEQLSPLPASVPVLVDASKSMQLFAHDTAVYRALAALEKWNSDHAGEKHKFTFYFFGDSLRPFRKPASFSFQDCRSFLPETFKDRTLRRAAAMLIISDGNWSNAALPAENYLDKNALYLPLRGAPELRPYLQMEISDFPSVSPVDSPLVAIVKIEGFFRNPDTIIVRITENKRTISMRKIPVPKGFFKQDAKIPLKNIETGLNFFGFSAYSRVDTFYCSRYAQHSALPSRFIYKLCNSKPAIDRRFMQMALKRQPLFKETLPGQADERSIDLLVIFNWDDSARTAMNTLKPGGAALFMGCIPCTSPAESIPAAKAVALIRPVYGTQSSPFDDLDLNKLPPPSQYFCCGGLSSSARNTFISAVLPRTGKPGTDTVDVLFTGRHRRNNFIAFAATEAWRWDFWPLAVEPDEGRTFAFSERLIELTKNILLNGLSEDLLLFPSVPFSETDSLQFLTVFPAHLPLSSSVRLSMSFSSADTVPYDTVFEMNFTGNLHQILRLRAMPAGHYRLKVSAAVSTHTDGLRCSFPDSLSIDQDRSEYLAQGQNTSLLRTLAQPLDDYSEPSLRAAFFSGAAAETKRPFKETMRLNRSWPLLLMILFVFAAEWIAQRVLKAE